MKKYLKRSIVLSISMLVINGHAEELSPEEQAVPEQQQVIVDSRPLSQATQLQMEEARQSELEESEQVFDQIPTQVGGTLIPIKSHNLLALASDELQSTAANPCTHHQLSIASFHQEATFKTIKTKDGAEWSYDKADDAVVDTWKPQHTVVVTPKSSLDPKIFGSHYNYVMTNKDVGSSVNVNLCVGSNAFGSWTTWVVGIDQSLGQVHLLNGRGEKTIWEISKSDMYLFKDWKVNDTVIIGENDSWFWYFSSYNHIIINVNMNHYIRSRQIYPMVG